MVEFRCLKCHRLLCKGDVCSVIEVECPKCSSLLFLSSERNEIIEDGEVRRRKKSVEGKAQQMALFKN